MQGNNNIIIEKTSRLAGIVKAPPSKSYTHRAIMVCSINGKCIIKNPLYSNDTIATINAWKKLGVIIKKGLKQLQITGFRGLPIPRTNSINVGESGTLLRFILPIIALARGNFIIKGEGTLLGRSNRTIVEALKSWDIDISGKGRNQKLPINLKSSGGIKGGKTFISGAEGSQAVSSFLIAAPFAKKDTTIILKNKLVSKPYVDITIDVIQEAGIKVTRNGYRRFFVQCNQRFTPKKIITVHGDYSSAAFLMAAACLIPSEVTILDLVDDKQGDKKIIDILNKMGAKIKHIKNKVEIKGPFELKGIEIDCGDTPDLVPILAVIGCFAKGKTTIKNISHLAHKESNRITAPAGELMKLGAKISTTNNRITINQVFSHLQPGNVSACNDHRMAMALTVAGLRIGDIRISGVECMSKSYPSFLKDIKSLGAKFRII